MSLEVWLLALAVIILIAGAAYWELVLCEGAHLGPRVVAATYNWVAHRYDTDIKQFDLATESAILGLPLATALIHVDQARVLDLAAGTGRTARALLRELAFDGTVINVDLSRRMLEVGQATMPEPLRSRTSWLRAPIARLPFDDDAFDAVVCLGCVIRGETTHYEAVAGECASGIQAAQLETGVPIAFGALTVENLDQALARSEGPGGHNVGEDGAKVAVEMARLLGQIRSGA